MTMGVWKIWNFDGEDTPHYDTAIIEAESEAAALDHLEAIIEAGGGGDTIWNPRPRKEWRSKPFDGEFVLGGGCR